MFSESMAWGFPGCAPAALRAEQSPPWSAVPQKRKGRSRAAMVGTATPWGSLAGISALFTSALLYAQD